MFSKYVFRKQSFRFQCQTSTVDVCHRILKPNFEKTYLLKKIKSFYGFRFFFPITSIYSTSIMLSKNKENRTESNETKNTYAWFTNGVRCERLRGKTSEERNPKSVRDGNHDQRWIVFGICESATTTGKIQCTTTRRSARARANLLAYRETFFIYPKNVRGVRLYWGFKKKNQKIICFPIWRERKTTARTSDRT